MHPVYVATVLHGMAMQFLGVQSDLVQFPITYYFHAVHNEHDLVAWFPYVLQLADRGSNENDSTVANSARLLKYSLQEVLNTIAPFVDAKPSDPIPVLIERWQGDHLVRQD
jgi:hypothetical protein